MTMADRLLAALREAAAQRYGGEAVSELVHSLQCAELARAAGANEDLVLACLLHDVGRYAVDQRLVYDRKESSPQTPGRGRGHHELGADLVAAYVSERVAWLIRMHADAKRYLCASEPDYYDLLSPASRRTLELQGGVLDADEVTALSAHPWLPDALRLRRWDDRAKDPLRETPPLSTWEPLLRRHFTHKRV
jgi:predicted HD phosphohydrolase